MEAFEGVGVSPDESWAGNKVGVVDAVKVRDDEVGPGMLDRIWREGLRSCWLLRRELEALSLVLDAVRLGLRTGDDSREPNGDGLTDVLAEDCLEDEPSICAVEMLRLYGAPDVMSGADS